MKRVAFIAAAVVALMATRPGSEQDRKSVV